MEDEPTPSPDTHDDRAEPPAHAAGNPRDVFEYDHKDSSQAAVPTGTGIEGQRHQQPQPSSKNLRRGPVITSAATAAVRDSKKTARLRKQQDRNRKRAELERAVAQSKRQHLKVINQLEAEIAVKEVCTLRCPGLRLTCA